MAVIALPGPTTASSQCPVLQDNAQAITPSDVDTFSVGVAVFVGTGGTVTCTPWARDTDVTVTVPDGGFVPFRVKAVKATGTAALLLVAVY